MVENLGNNIKVGGHSLDNFLALKIHIIKECNVGLSIPRFESDSVLEVLIIQFMQYTSHHVLHMYVLCCIVFKLNTDFHYYVRETGILHIQQKYV